MKYSLFIYLMVLLNFLNPSMATAAEVDQFSNMQVTLPDVAPLINSKANKMVDEALSRANTQGSCNESVLYKELRVPFHNHIKGKLVHFIFEDSSVAKRTLQRPQTIYRDFNMLDGFLMARPGADKSGVGLGTVIQFGDITMGSDKFEHLFGRGFKYFTQHYLQNKPLEKVLRSGIRGEKGYFGGSFWATGVFSYGDLVANFNGMRFWNHILQKNPDLLGQNLGPYIVCQNNQWQQVKDIDFRPYFDSGVDETINCSQFARKHAAATVRDNMSKMGMSCPLDSSLLLEIYGRYQPYSDWLINMDGHVQYNKVRATR